MSLDKNDVQKIAHLARLEINENQTKEYAEQISNILTLVEQMQSVSTEGIEPMSHPMHATQRLREDVVSETNKRETLQAGAPAIEKGFFLVPKVID